MPDTDVLELTKKELDKKIEDAAKEAVEKALKETPPPADPPAPTPEQLKEKEKAEAEKQAKIVQAAIKGFLMTLPPITQKAWGFPAIIGERGEKRSFGEVLRAINTDNKRALEKYEMIGHDEEVKTIVEGTATSGGYLIPVEYETEIDRIIEENTVAMMLARKTPMKYMTKNKPIVTAGIAAHFVDEETEKTKSDWTLGQIQLVAKKICTLTVVSNEELEDSDPSAESVLMEEFGIAIGNRIDLAAFEGTGAGATDPWTGIYNLASVVSQGAGAALDFDPIFTAIGKALGNRAKNIDIVYNPVIEGLLRKIKGDDGQYVWANASGTSPATIGGYPVHKDHNLSKTLGAGLDETWIAGGDFQRMYFGLRSGIVIAKGYCDLDFEKDRTSFRAVRRVAHKIHTSTENQFFKVTGIKVPA